MPGAHIDLPMNFNSSEKYSSKIFTIISIFVFIIVLMNSFKSINKVGKIENVPQ
jgi:hypothetical protein